MIYSEPVTSTQPIPIQPGTVSSYSLPARAIALGERVVNTRRGTDAVVARLQELRESSSMSSVAAVSASGSGTRQSDHCDVFDCDLDFEERTSSDAENCELITGVYQRQRRETFAKRSSTDSLLEHYDSESFSEEGSSTDGSDVECEDCECGCNKNAYISRRFLNSRKSADEPTNRNPFNPYADNSDLEMMELDHEDLMPPAGIRSVGEVIGYVNVVRAERQEALQRLEGLLSQIGETWMSKRNQNNLEQQN